MSSKITVGDEGGDRRLENEVAIVIGAARGIGREYGIRFAEEGASVVAADVIDCGETVGAVEKAGGRVLALKVDVADAKSTQAMAEETRSS